MLIQLVFVQWGVSPPILYYTELCGSMFACVDESKVERYSHTCCARTLGPV